MGFRGLLISTDNAACRVLDKLIKTGRYSVKLGNGTLPSVKEEKMIRVGTRGAEGKQKGNERKELDQ